MKTSEFKYFQFPFSEFNKVQKKVIPLVETGQNLVVSFKPGTGKTAIAEACFGYHLSISNVSKVAYICPLKALANQKLEDWKIPFRKYGICMISGDSNQTVNDIGDSRLVIFTSESFDSAMRRKSSVLNSFFCICFDEAHLIGDESRGVAYESGILAASKIEGCRLVLLSGTMANTKEIAKWIKLITGHPTAICASDWTPNETKIEFHYVSRYKEIDKVVDLLNQYKNTKTIVFVHSKLIGKKILTTLKEKKIRAAFHNSTLSNGKRKRMEELFTSLYSGVDVIVATSTLSAGVNLA